MSDSKHIRSKNQNLSTGQYCLAARFFSK